MRTQQERAEQLYDLFVAHGAAVESVAAMAVNDLAQQIHEMREAESDDIPMSDLDVARAILDFARS